MASRRCGCASDQCACVITGGTGVEVSGSGTKTNPYVLEADLATPNLAVTDEGTVIRTGVVGLNFTGGGVQASTGAAGEVVVNVPAPTGIAGITMTVQTFTANGTWTRPANLLWVSVELVGGGGGSGGVAATSSTQNGASGAGGGGGYVRKLIPAASLAASVAVTVGAGGTAGAATPAAGGTGGTTSFGAACSATGGGGGAVGVLATTNAHAQTAPVGGGAGTGGDVNIQGGPGRSGQIIGGRAALVSTGGESPLGPTNVPTFNTVGAPGYPYGGGAAGSTSDWSQAARAGSAGGGGVVIVTSFIKT